MAHELTQREDGKFEFAFAGEQTWHGLGQELTPGAPIEQWITEAGLDWNIEESQVSFDIDHHKFGSLKRMYPDRKVLFRSDNLKPLGIVSDRYQVVQPKEVLEFFRDLTDTHGFELSAAGSLYGGTRFWATAKTGMRSVIDDSNDTIEGYLLLTTSCDGTLSTVAMLTSTRTVCANTMRVALAGKSKNLVKVTHLREFDPKQVKIEMGVLHEGWENYMDKLRKLSTMPVTDTGAFDLIKEQETRDNSQVSERTVMNKIKSIFDLYKSGAGAEYCEGNRMGVLNAYTNFYTHGSKGRSQQKSSGFWNSYMGEWSNKKNEVMESLLETS